MDRGSLEFMLDDNLEVSEAVMAAIVYQILWGLGYLHYDNRLVRGTLHVNCNLTRLLVSILVVLTNLLMYLYCKQHRDIKPGNILIVSRCSFLPT